MLCKVLAAHGALGDLYVSNNDLSKFVDTSDEWIRSRVGIEQRYFAKDKTLVAMAYEAALGTTANIDIDSLDAVIVATTSPDNAFPSVASQIHGALGMKQSAMAFDIAAACAGFVYGIKIASAFLFQGNCKRILLIGADKMSNFLDWNDRSVAVLFGDGAGAVVLEKDSSKTYDINSDSIFFTKANFDILYVDNSDSFIKMKGPEVFKNAIVNMTDSIKSLLNKNHLSIDQIDMFVLHQANLRIIDNVVKLLSIEPTDNRIIRTVHMHGNTSAASIPLALANARTMDRFKDGGLALLCGVGAGFVCGSALVSF